MTDLFSYLLPYPAFVLRSDSDPKLNLQRQSFVWTLIPNLNFFVSCSFFLLKRLCLVDSRRSSLVIKQLSWKCCFFRCHPQLVLKTCLCVLLTRWPDTADVSATSCDVGFFFSVSYVVSLPNCRHVVDRLRFIR